MRWRNLFKRSKTERETMRRKNLIVSWHETKQKWGLYRKSNKKDVLRWIGNDEDVVRLCQAYRSVELPSELRQVEDRMEAEREAAEEVRMKAQAEASAQEIERREKYLESLSEEDREDVLKRERERERKRKFKPGEKRTILDIANEEAEVFPWEGTSKIS